MILQHIYKPILNFFYDKITYRVSDNVRNIIIFVCMFSIFAAQFTSQYVFHFECFNRGIRDYLVCLLMGIIILFSVNRRLETIKWNMWIYVPFTVIGTLLLIASVDHEMGPAYQAFPLTMLVAFMCLYYVWGNRENPSVLFELAAKAYLLFIGILFCICILKYPYESTSYTPGILEYAPFGINPNGVTKIFIPGAACGLYLLIKNFETRIGLLYAAFSGFCIAVTVLTKCRAGQICIVLISILLLIYIINRGRIHVDDRRKNISKTLILLIAVIGSVFLGMFMLDNVSNKVAIQEGSNKIITEIQTQEEQVVDIEANERQIIINERISKSKAEIYENDQVAKLDYFMAGRLAIWNVYFDNMSWKGNDELLFYDTEYAHNQYIELSYKAGYPVGILYLAFVIIAGLYLIKSFLQKKVLPEDLFKIMIWSIFFVISMLDTGILPFERGFIFLFYVLMASVFVKKIEKE